ncbi:ArsR family transcriptional regulator [Saccharopolyspora lacisalsi]|uniref:ArsR family transcriptional regulator n=1 Tax=Halosaccharopolyspora lacisalsi TaxID=1000566 RepID=A0A839DTN5_9PSEU|nr:metalloregulator ArsR/SmtB family transcription factor [Halosaccharopolyspora lacisalsi]MBA8824119.1 ArsR family transcriptional regulator [Halosaccharopolyspora lacisalsi]
MPQADHPNQSSKHEPRSRHPERVATARAALPGEDALFRVTRSLHLLGEAARLRIVVALLAAGELSVNDLAVTIGLSEAATSQHLRLLRSESMVGTRREGRTIYYSLDDDHVRELVELALAHDGHRD